MTTGDWLFYYVTEAVKWLEPVLYAVGLVVAVRSFRHCRRRGYIVLALYFGLCIFSVLAMPHINRAIRSRRAPDISEQTRQKIDEAVRQATERVLEEAGHPIVYGTHHVSFPLGPLVLVAGVWLLARREPRKEAEPCAGGNAAAPRASA